jgi:long-chain acyl-CoA synthetase
MKNRDSFNTLVEMLEKASYKYPRRVALVFGRKRIIYQDLIVTSKRLASSLYNLGVREFDRVCLWLPNLPEFVYSFFAILFLRAIVCPINSMFRREEAKFIIEDCGAKVLITSIDKMEDALNLLSRLDTLKSIIVVSSPKDRGVVLDFNDLISKSPVLDKKFSIKADDVAEIIYTSGTTGRPKGAILTHRNLVTNIKDCIKAIKVTKRDSFICILPLFHSFASTVCMLLPLSCGAKVVIMRALRPFKRVIRAIFRNRVTIFVAVPSVYNILAESKIPKYKLLLSYFFNPIRICISGAAALDAGVTKRFEKKFRRPILQGYGLTEASPVVSLNPIKGKRKPESVGLPLPLVEVKVVDKEDRFLGPDSIGHLLVRGPNVMKGYYKLEEETKKALKDGWLYTGDLAKIDRDGFIYIMGRIKEMINVRGLNVYPKEIEDLLYKHPKVKEAAVVGVPHRHRGEAPVAFIVKEGEVGAREVIGYLRANLAPYKVPLKVLFKESLPKNPTGKILKRELQQEVMDIFK